MNTQESKTLSDHNCLFMTHFESTHLQKKKNKQKVNWWGFLLCLNVKRGMTMTEYVFLTEAILYSVAIALLL